MSTPSKPTILFLGATGGCTLACLIQTLKSSTPYHAIALARTPSKLTTLLTAAGIPESTLSTSLTIHQGNALSPADVKAALLLASPSADAKRLPNTIISGLGGAPRFQFSINPLKWITIDDATVCGTAAGTLVTALRELLAEYPELAKVEQARPLLGFISTTGITRPGMPEDVPFMMRFLYHIVLAVPHKDKKNMEEAFRGGVVGVSGEAGGVFRDVIGVRPTLLTDGVETGKIRVGREKAPELGYTVSRKDVGLWVYKNVVQGNGEGWEGEMASLTN